MPAIEAAHRAWAQGRAVNTPTIESLIPHPFLPEAGYGFKQMSAATAEGVQALRINSEVPQWPAAAGTRRRTKIPAADGRWVGLVFLFDPASGRPLALFPDGMVQRLRVCAANGLAARYLAPRPGREMALMGSGGRAEAQCLWLPRVVGAEVVRVYRPNPAHVEAFCGARRLGWPPA